MSGRRAVARQASLEAALGYSFADPALLDQALTHASAVGHGERRSNERLEFLGDRVLGLLIAHLLVDRFPDEAEGPLTHRHVALVQKAALADVGRRLGLGRSLRLAPSEAGDRDRPALLADACEAVLGAIYLDGGLEPARALVARAWEPLLSGMAAPPRDTKTSLQEWAQARGLDLPAYSVVATSGPAHARRFTVAVELAGADPALAEGASKRAAEREAARILLAQLEERP